MTQLETEDSFGVQRMVGDLQSLPGVDAVRPFNHGVSVECAEADFVIRMLSGNDPACDTEWQVTVREPMPGLNTWWGTWRRSFAVPRADAGPLIADELRAAIERVRGMLDDHAGTGISQVALQDA